MEFHELLQLMPRIYNVSILTWFYYDNFSGYRTYSIAEELEMPFGKDLNDVDLDNVAHSIVEDVLNVHESQSPYGTLIFNNVSPPGSWTAKRFTGHPNREPPRPCTKWKYSEIMTEAQLAAQAAPLWKMLVLATWSTVVVAISFANAKFATPTRCRGLSFCSVAVIDKDITDFIGFALFFLLGFLVNRTHARFVTGQKLWKDGITALCRRLTNSVLQSFEPSSFHNGDVDRIVGHLAAIPITLAAELRRTAVPIDMLSNVMGDVDAHRVVASHEPVFYCLDVVRAYFFYAETLAVTTTPSRNGMPTQERFLNMRYLEHLQKAAVEARALVRVGLPFGYSMHVRVFLMAWLAVLPFALVQAAGWLTILWVLLIGYGLIGVLHWADQLVDPFGTDELDLPLDRMRDEVVGEIGNLMPLFENGSVTFLDIQGDCKTPIS